MAFYCIAAYGDSRTSLRGSREQQSGAARNGSTVAGQHGGVEGQLGTPSSWRPCGAHGINTWRERTGSLQRERPAGVVGAVVARLAEASEGELLQNGCAVG